MDNNIVQTVYDTLEARTAEIAEIRTEYDKMEAMATSGKYTRKALEKDVFPKRDALKRQMQDQSAAAIKEARGLIDQYRADVAAESNLDPLMLTEDIELLKPGIVLLPRDIAAILERNAGNKTMTQITLRYAKEHGIDTRGIHVPNDNEETIARNLENIVYYYEKWIHTPRATKMLHTFFNIKD